MLQFDAVTVALCVLGFVLHVLTRWGEFRKTAATVGLVEYLRLDVPGWTVAVLSTVAAYLILPEAGAILGASVSLTPLGALTAGYMGSSLGAKLPALFGRTGGLR